ncbi:hypothetical protein [Bradyrhizobium sp. DASA03007]|uniref:hypothetical protein n=1 Tax=unclassified Bradyrhizobium TaxID=2631580 RepID=UPI003F729E80
MDELEAAFESCATYRAVAGKVLFSGGSGPIIDGYGLASRLFSKGVQYAEDIDGAVDWVIRLMTTQETTRRFKAAFWGLQVDQDAWLSTRSRLMPFDALPESHMKRRIVERARRCYDGSQWMMQSYFDKPSAAFVEDLPGFPYIRADNAAFLKMNEMVWKVETLSVLAQASAVGHPIAVACWFEYADTELEWAEWENSLTWLLPEIHPAVKRTVSTDIAVLNANIRRYASLAEDYRARVFRSMERFRLSQSRQQPIDRVLDLALAFEIALSDQGDNAPPSWKVSVRSAQLIGGPLTTRQKNRDGMAVLYDLRNQATHGGSLKAKNKKPVEQVLEESFGLYVAVVNKLLSLGSKPDWKSIELEPSNG